MFVIGTDKNCGTMLMSQEYVIEQALKHLKDPKGTFKIVDEPAEVILDNINSRFEQAVKNFDNPKTNSPALRSVIHKFREWNIAALENGELCSCNALPKVHKPPDENGIWSRLIIPGEEYITVQASNFLHSQFQLAVSKNDLILEDSSQLIALLDQMKIDDDEQLLLNTADVTALYPSIDIEDGIKALDWFMETFMSDTRTETKEFMSMGSGK